MAEIDIISLERLNTQIFKEQKMLPDLLALNLALVICGTAKGKKSAEIKHYYADSRNKFWRTLHEVKLTPRRLRPDEYQSLLDERIGLTDLVKDKSGMDKGLNNSDFDIRTLSNKMHEYQPEYLCFNGKRAAEKILMKKKVDYGLQAETIGETRIYVAHSTSGVNARWDIKSWEKLAKLINTSG